jgi:hypothetical protein
MYSTVPRNAPHRKPPICHNKNGNGNWRPTASETLRTVPEPPSLDVFRTDYPDAPTDGTRKGSIHTRRVKHKPSSKRVSPHTRAPIGPSDGCGFRHYKVNGLPRRGDRPPRPRLFTPDDFTPSWMKVHITV